MAYREEEKQSAAGVAPFSLELKASRLDESQKVFCSAPGRSVRLLAPAGSGKTYSLLWRCLNIMKSSAQEAPRFLLFTFTRAARDELRDRLKQDPLFNSLKPRLEITTLNSWGFRRLRSRMHTVKVCVSGADRYLCMNHVLKPVWEKYSLIANLLTQSKTRYLAIKILWELSDTLKSLGFRHDIHSDLEAFKEHCQWIALHGMQPHLRAIAKILTDLEIVKDEKKPLTDIHKNYILFWAEAVERLYQSSLITLEDQKYWALFDLEKTLREGKYTTGMHRFDHIMVDEFQDINTLDLNLLKMIAEANKSELTIVGDDDQAIYEWRGATPRFILDPEDCIGNPYHSCILEVNYRSPKNIVEYSQKLIRHNKRRIEKKVIPASTVEADIQVYSSPRLTDSVNYVLQTVNAMLASQDIQNVAILGRKRSQIIPYQIIFASKNIPFYAAEDLHIFLSEAFNELKELLAIKARAHLTGLYALDPVGQFLTLCDKVKRFPLSKKDREALHKYMHQNTPKSLTEAIQFLPKYRGPLKGDNRDGRMSEKFCEAIVALLDSETVSESIGAISQHFNGLQKDYGKALEDIFYTDPPFLYLSEYAERYGEDYEAFYTDIEKAIATLAKIPNENEENEEEEPAWKLPLHLMTALRAKGKEFDAIIILDANEGIWPSKLATEEDQKEQERRVFYVAFTRARKRIIILVDDHILGSSALPSPYLEEMGLPIRLLPENFA